MSTQVLDLWVWVPGACEEMPRAVAVRERGGKSRRGKEEGGRETK